ncbi:IS4 family transposase [Gloeothece verrucosa]|uniref:IS4 family transposase n=1 Tax=Gloeothece verrucosa TaxID=2546359 RepID=UPI0002E407BE|nr:IS4 family transposase [Gloeothece verrucosa]
MGCSQKLWIQPPVKRAKKEQLPAIPVTVILAEEEHPPSGEKPVSWLLITTREIKTFDGACVCVERYSYRFLIERYHYVLKSGCQLEKLQLKTAARIEKALACYAIVAWRLLWLTYEARVYGKQSPEFIFKRYEWQSLYCFLTRQIRPPTEIPTLNQCIRWIANLGGFIGRKSDKDPGVKVIWRGLKRLDDIAKSWVLGFQYGMLLTGKMLC